MALTNPKKLINVEELNYFHTLDKTQRSTEISTAVATETTARQSADTTLQGNIDAITAKIPTAASSTNQLTDKAYVDDAISTSEATFRGNFATKAALDAYAGEKNKNDTAVVEADETHSDQCSMYQYSGTAWDYKFKVRDTAFTTAQLAAINSGITGTKVSGYDTHIAATNNPHSVTPTQVFSDYSSYAGKFVKVKSDGSGFEYSDAGATYSAGDGITISSANVISANAAETSDIDEIFA